METQYGHLPRTLHSYPLASRFYGVCSCGRAARGWKKKKALPQKTKLYLVKRLGAVYVEDGNLKVEGTEILQMVEMGVRRSLKQWKELLDDVDAKAMVVFVDMDKPNLSEHVTTNNMMAVNTTSPYTSETSRSWNWGVISLSLVSPLLVTYLISLWNSSTTIRKYTNPRRPPTAPYYLPYIGHALDLVTRPLELYKQNWLAPDWFRLRQWLLTSPIRKRFGRDGLWQLCLPGQDSFQVSTPDQIAKVFRAQGMMVSDSIARSLERSFGMPKRAASLYERDDSGYGPNILPDSKVKPNERILLAQHDFTARNLSGEGLTSIVSHYQRFLVEAFTELLKDMGDDWVEIPDLSEWMQTHVTKSAILSMYGPHMIRLNPDLVHDLWTFLPDVQNLYLGIPRWLLPAPYRLRDKILDSITRYYQHAYENYDPDGPDQDWEEFFGSRFIRNKHMELWEKFEPMDTRARAAEDMSFLWAWVILYQTTRVEAAIWYVVEFLRDPELFERLESEVAESQTPPEGKSTAPMFDLEKLCSMPVSQAVYAEVLRLRVFVLIMRKAKRDLDFAGWSIKKGERVCAASITGAFDDRIWNTGTVQDPHPLNKFWADRFLVYPNDPSSGPLKSPPVSKNAAADKHGKSTDGPRFSMTGLTNTWIPYSGGPRLCPGRHFAKREIIVTAAVMMSMFDIELLTPEGWDPQPDPTTFGHGTLPIKGKVPCRIRKKQT
ncbi:hypothetical protein IL306_004791 [Fusarium sp. DS 682]|nr:hypothetical protein IL306_004791 [Fusarium sp. DS 682]